MSELSEEMPRKPGEHGAQEEVPPAEFWPLEPWPGQPMPVEEATELPGSPLPIAEPVLAQTEAATAQPPAEAEAPPGEAPLFESFTQPEIVPPTRIPHFGHLCVLCLLVIFGLMCAGGLTLVALHYHLFGISTVEQANTDIHYTLGTEGVAYLLTFAGCLMIFPPWWHESFFAGIAWRGPTALRFRKRLLGAALVCFLLAMVNGWLLPGPTNAPIDKIFRLPGAAWLLFGFGVTFAPFFEEIFFRGFLLPALCTSCDWVSEQATGKPPRPLDAGGQPQWSVPAMAIGSVFTSIPFAWMHAEQTGYSLGPFLLLMCVSLVLCWARLGARSLAASVLVHASYNFMLFSLMLLGTGGFRHLDKM